MKIGMVIRTDEPKTVWNAYRLANFALNEEDNVRIFLLAKGVESETGSEKYNVKEQVTQFVSKSGKIYTCGTCMKSRQIDS